MLMSDKFLLALVIAIASFLAGMKVGSMLGKADLMECRERVALMEAVSNELQKEIAEQRLVSERITADVSQRWADALAWQRANPRVVRVRDEACGSGGGMSGLSTASAGLDVGTAHSGLGAYLTAAQCEERLNQAVLDAAQLMWLQEWIREQQRVSK